MKHGEISKRENRIFILVPFIICLLFLSGYFPGGYCQTDQGIYKIQVASSVTQVPVQKIQKDLRLTEAVTEHQINGRYKYFVGKFSNIKEAQKYLVNVPVKGAFVVRIASEPVVGETVIPKDKPKETLKEIPKEMSKEKPKEVLKEMPKEKTKEIPKTVTTTVQENKPLSPSVKINENDRKIADTKAKPDGTLLYDGKNYAYTTIGMQTWMVENLAYLPAVSPSSTGSFFKPQYYVYNYEGNKVTEAKGTSEYAAYGVLYNWEAAKGVCPPGWHLPIHEEWTILAYYLGANAGGKLKETGSAHWASPNSDATNESRFAALPGGFLQGFGAGFFFIGDCANFWTASSDNVENASGISLYRDASNVWRDNSPISRANGLSVRCVRD